MVNSTGDDGSGHWSKSSGNSRLLPLLRIVAREFNNFWHQFGCGLIDVAFPVLDGDPVNAQALGQLALDEVNLKPASFEVFTERFRCFEGSLGAFQRRG